MPPKKVEEPERKPLIGRVGTNLKIGIVGIPNVGKSTFFNVLTKSQAAAENFPFCTIDPNENKYQLRVRDFFYTFPFFSNLLYLFSTSRSSSWCEVRLPVRVLQTRQVSLFLLFKFYFFKLKHPSNKNIKL